VLLKKHKIEFDERLLWTILPCPFRAAVLLLYETQGDGVKRLCPGLICVGLSAPGNASVLTVGNSQDIEVLG